MKKRAVIVVIIAIILAVAGGVWLYAQNKTESRYISNATAARMLALLRSDFDIRGQENWEEIYINYLSDLGLLEVKKTRDFNYANLRRFLNAYGITAKELQQETDIDVNKYNGKIRVRQSDFSKIYDYLVATLANGAVIIQDIVISVPKGGDYDVSGIEETDYLDKKVRAYVRGHNIIKIISKLSDEVVYRNVWLIKGEAREFSACINGNLRNFATGGLSCDFSETIGDIYVSQGKVVKIVLKRDTIHGKVYMVNSDYIEIEGYGMLPLDSDFAVYRTYMGTEYVNPSEILVGYDLADFSVADGRVCAGVIKRALNADEIRVLIMSSGYTSIFHERVSVTSEDKFIIKHGDMQEEFAAGDIVDLYREAEIMKQGRVTIEPANIGGKIQLLNVKRNQGTPAYRGKIDVNLHEEGLVVVNQVPMEEYLYGVVPSEMPVGYGVEALKTQAVCARSYAYRQIMGNSYASYGAHVDDSVNFQVYNNSEEKEASTQAVKETYGQVVALNGNIVSTYYYSTSCGHSSSNDIWSGAKASYLPSKTINETHSELDLSSETAFKDFISAQNEKDYDYGYAYYRWNVVLPLSVITDSVNSNLYSRYYAAPSKILVLENGSWVQKDIRNIGDVTAVEVIKRSDSGAVSEMIITGTKATVKIIGEYNARFLLGPKGCTINLLKGTKITNMLPSAFFRLEEYKENGKLCGYTVYGGGYGHGIGMSQNAVAKMITSGMKYDEILKYFYEGTEIISVYRSE